MNREELQRIIDRYLDGVSTDSEEARLREYFAQSDVVPEEWRPYKALFGWEAGQCGRYGFTANARKSRKAVLLVAASVAAAIALAVVWPRSHADYAYIDGQRTTDDVTIREEAEAALALVTTQEEDIFGIMNSEI